MDDIDITGLDQAALLSALYNGTKPLGLGVLQDLGRDMTRAEASTLLALAHNPEDIRFDYVLGRPVKVAFRKGKLVRPDLYDRDAGDGACARIVAALRKGP